jgi:hypothetical protein
VVSDPQELSLPAASQPRAKTPRRARRLCPVLKRKGGLGCMYILMILAGCSDPWPGSNRYTPSKGCALHCQYASAWSHTEAIFYRAAAHHIALILKCGSQLRGEHQTPYQDRRLVLNSSNAADMGAFSSIILKPHLCRRNVSTGTDYYHQHGVCSLSGVFIPPLLRPFCRITLRFTRP